MADHPTSLDAHRGMAAQKATELRRLRSEVDAEQGNRANRLCCDEAGEVVVVPCGHLSPEA